jgi:magnesium transporter
MREIPAFGKLGFVGTQRLEHPIVNVTSFSEDHMELREKVDIPSLAAYNGSKNPVWINVCGVHDTSMISEIAEIFGLHPAVIDKITNTGTRASFEDFDDYLVVAVKMLKINGQHDEVEAEHILFVLHDQVLLTFQENDQDPFDPIRERMLLESNRIRKGHADYLMFSLLRAVLNDYRYLIEQIGEKIEALEDVILDRPSGDILGRIGDYKLEINYILKFVRPARDAILQLCKSESEFIHPGYSERLMNNVLELALIASDSSENYRMILNDEMNIYHTNVASRLNEMFRILTVFSVIFVPLTFIAGIYGMNFEYIPELSYHNAYFILWGIMILVALGMIVYFKRKGWL